VKEVNYASTSSARRSNGDYYHYTYDAVGNRLSQTTSISGQVSTINYVYDDANRLSSVDGVTYTYDNNGNLLNDGVNAYEYDSANRLISFTNATTTVTYRYNGLGDRLQETVNGITTTFTMDLNAGLTQALSDGTNTYIYGVGRIAQMNGNGTEYFLGDALGSVRQLANSSGSITYARAYDPYGVVTNTSGSSQSAYGYTGENYGDSTQLLYLRSRYYSGGTGRFLTRDTWAGDYNRPLSLNQWNYTEGNPINFVDPTGHHVDCPLGYIPVTKGCVRIPNIVSRTQWGAKPIQAKIVCAPHAFGACVEVGEGFYDSECNPSGYALYSELYPNKTLSDIYDTIVIHHAGNQNNATIQSIQNEHMEKGDVDIDYHYVIAKDGTIYEGRDIGARGAHVEGANTGKIGVLVIGDFEPGDYADLPGIGEVKFSSEPADNPTSAQKNSLMELSRYLDALYSIDRIVGHRYYNQTRCPGENLMPFVDYLNDHYRDGP
jgi:RHS repeat-associated protein